VHQPEATELLHEDPDGNVVPLRRKLHLTQAVRSGRRGIAGLRSGVGGRAKPPGEGGPQARGVGEVRIRKRVPLSQVHAAAPVTNTWRYGRGLPCAKPAADFLVNR
jgi:hypothetical protein